MTKIGAEAKLLTIKSFICSICEADLEYVTCIECHKRLKDMSTFRCFGSFHRCEKCHAKITDLKCPSCSNREIDRMNVDISTTHKAIMYTCRDCNNIWTSKPVLKDK